MCGRRNRYGIRKLKWQNQNRSIEKDIDNLGGNFSQKIIEKSWNGTSYVWMRRREYRISGRKN